MDREECALNLLYCRLSQERRSAGPLLLGVPSASKAQQEGSARDGLQFRLPL